ncbi:Disease resistance protein [Melia azedarach]|uniref:Disease resistance protein n=1 Tax=Melia azedarach TaxID=155640 RepID=A0ACC1XNU5_MELAZ|nr:Disease resistance protein [Melia azedarach]
MTVIGALEKLEILFIQHCDVKELPVEVRQLTRLRSLELRDCFELEVIPPNVISHLSNLEELRTGSFAEWEVEGNIERRNASLYELKHLPKLTALQICIKDANTLARDLFFKRLERYKILIIRDPWVLKYTSGNTPPEISRQFKLELTNTNISLKDGHIMQLRGIEDLYVDGLLDMKNILYGLNSESFPQLKYLKARNNPNLLCIIDSTEDVTPNASAFPLLESLSLINLPHMEKISCGQLAAESFGKLREIVVVDCNKLKNIFSFSVARGLLQLQSIEAFRCQNMEQIFAIGSEDESSNNNTGGINIIEFGQLRSLVLRYLPQLTSFCSRSNEIILADDIDIPNTLFNKKVTLPRLEVLELYETKVERIWQNQAVAMSCGIQNLTRLIISSCKNLRCLFSSSIATSFVQLQHLQICQCPALEEMVVDDDRLREEQRKNVVFPQLVLLKMKTLQNLTKFCSAGVYIEFPSLKKLEIEQCPELKGFVLKNNISTDLTEIPLFNEKVAFPSLESLSISDCDSMEAIFDLDGPNFEDQLSALTHLSELEIIGLPKLRHVWKKDSKKFICQNLMMVKLYGLHTTEWPALKTLEVSGWEIVNILFNSEFHRFQRGQLDIRAQPPQFLVEKVFPNLEELIVQGKGIATIGQFPENFLGKLKFLHFVFDESAVFSSLDFLQRFHNIKVLNIGGCSTCGPFEAVENGITAGITELNECCDVKHLLKEETNMDHLLHLYVGACHNLEKGENSEQGLNQPSM